MRKAHCLPLSLCGCVMTMSRFFRQSLSCFLAISMVVFSAEVVGATYSAYEYQVGRKLSAIAGSDEDGQSVYRRNLDGHFYVEAAIGNKTVIFLVDTGATKTILSEFDAKRLGIVLAPSNYIERYETPNGLITAAPVLLDKMIIGDIEFNGVRASVSSMRLKQSILGMNILSQLNMNLIGNKMILSELQSTHQQ